MDVRADVVAKWSGFELWKNMEKPFREAIVLSPHSTSDSPVH